jgi:hypothetical protein
MFQIVKFYFFLRLRLREEYSIIKMRKKTKVVSVL